jgi:RNA polymerase sigma-70 factor (ECF subfamily)
MIERITVPSWGGWSGWLAGLQRLLTLRPRDAALEMWRNQRLASVEADGPTPPVGGASNPHAVVDALYQRHARAVLAYLTHRLRDPRDAEDILAEVFIAALGACAGGERPGLPWLLLVARRRVADFYRTHARVERIAVNPAPAEEPADPRDDPERLLLRAEERRELLALIETLPEEQREALALRFAAGLPSAQIAEILGKSDEATRALLSRAVRRLRKGWR